MTKEKWTFKGESFRNLDSFDKDGNSSGISYFDLPEHKINNTKVNMVWHNGSVFYTNIYWNKFPRVQLLAKTNLRPIKWTSIKNVAPIINTQIQKIV